MPVYVERQEALNQGDLFADVPFTLPRGDYERLSSVHPGLVVSHDCDCDKAVGRQPDAEPDRLVVTLMPVYPLERFASSGQAGDIRAGRIWRYLYLPAEGEQEERCADYLLMQPVPVPLLQAR